MMLNLFGKETFAQGYDIDNSIYLLVNKTMLRHGLITAETIEQQIAALYNGEYSIVLEP